jgi:hypothetical protein
MITIALATGISILTVRINALVTGIFLAIEMLALIVLALFGFLHVDRSLVDLIVHPVMLDRGKTSLVARRGQVVPNRARVSGLRSEAVSGLARNSRSHWMTTNNAQRWGHLDEETDTGTAVPT